MENEKEGRNYKFHVYQQNFYNDTTDEEIRVWFLAKNWFDAEEHISQYSLNGFISGIVQFVDKRKNLDQDSLRWCDFLNHPNLIKE